MDGYVYETGPDGVLIKPSKLPGILDLDVNGEHFVAYVADDMQLTLIPEIADESVLAGVISVVQVYTQQHPEFGAQRTEAALVHLNQAKIVKVGDSLIDADTGEWIADAHWGFQSDIQSLADVVTFMSRLSASDAVYAGHLQQREAVIKQMDAIIKRDESRRAYYAQWFPQLRSWAENNKPPKKQTIDTPWGKIAFRKASFDVKAELVNGDDLEQRKAIMAQAVNFCEIHEDLVGAVKVEKSVLMGEFNEILAQCPSIKLPDGVFNIVRGEESCTVDTGFGKVGSKETTHKIEAPKPAPAPQLEGGMPIPVSLGADWHPDMAIEPPVRRGPPPLEDDPLGD